MLTKTSFLILGLFSFSILYGAKEPMKFGKIPKEDLTMTSYEKFPDAEALVLGDYGKLSFNIGPSGIEYYLYHHKRIKVFKQAGFDAGDVTIYFRNKSQIKRLKAMVTNPDGSEYEVEDDQMFESKYNKNWSTIKFAFPNLQEGSVIEYRYDLISDDLFSLEDWYFQGEYPTRFSEFRTEIMEYLKYAKWFNGYGTLAVHDCGTSSKPMSGVSVSIDECRYVAEDLPGLKPEEYISTMSEYYFRIKFQLKAVKIPGQPYKDYMTSWGDAADRIKEDKDFGLQYLRKGNFNKLYDATAHLVSTATPSEKVRIFAEYIAENIEETARYNSIFVRNPLDESFENKKGTASERNLMLIALLQEHGVKAYPVLVSSLKNGKPVTDYPFIAQFDHVIVYTEIEGEGTYVDITNNLAPCNLPNPFSLNNAGLMIADETVGWVELKPKAASSKILLNLNLSSDGNLSGDLSSSHEDYGAYEERVNWNNDKTGSFWKERLQEKFPEAKATEINYEGMEQLEEPFKTTCQLEIPEAGTVAGDMIYLSPILYTKFDENPFKKEKRLFPVERSYPIKEQEVINLTLPEGYLVESLPESVNLSLPNKAGSFKYLVNPRGNLVQIISKIELNDTFYTPDQYGALKNFMDIIVQKMGEQIVLKKA